MDRTDSRTQFGTNREHLLFVQRTSKCGLDIRKPEGQGGIRNPNMRRNNTILPSTNIQRIRNRGQVMEVRGIQHLKTTQSASSVQKSNIKKQNCKIADYQSLHPLRDATIILLKNVII